MKYADIIKLFFFLIALAVVFYISVAKPVDAEDEWFCYAPYGKPVVAKHYVDTVRLKVNWLHNERGGVAWSEWTVNEDGTADCEIWVQRPKQPLGDPDMDALGHEVLHCLIGDFHGT